MPQLDVHRLDGYICPSCRLLFSVSRGEDAAVCPGCFVRLSCAGVVGGTAAVGSADEAEVRGSTRSGWQGRAGRLGRVAEGDWQEELPLEILSARAKGLPWQMLLPALVLGSMVFLVLVALLNETNRGGVVSPAVVATVGGEVHPARKVVLAEVENEDVVSLFGRLAASESVAELTKWLRNGDELKPVLESYYKGKPVKFQEVLEVYDLQSLPDHTNFYAVSVKFVEGGARGVVVENTEDGLKLDWAEYVAYGEMRWDELVRKRPEKSVRMRLIRQRVEYYNHGFDSDTWQSFDLSYPGSEDRLIGYAKKGGALMRKLQPIGGSEGEAQVILKIHYPKGVEDKRMVIIDELLPSLSWLVAEETEKL